MVRFLLSLFVAMLVIVAVLMFIDATNSHQKNPYVMLGCGTMVLILGISFIPGITNPKDPWGWLFKRRERRVKEVLIAVERD